MKAWKITMGLVVGGLALWFFLAGPVLLRCSLGPFLQDRLVILNPIRNRSPERLARQLITQVHSSNCMQVLGQMPDFQGKREMICGKQASDPLRSVCKLSDRVDFRDQVGISFACGYEGRSPIGAFVTLTFIKRDKGFVFQNYERIY